MQQLTLEVTLGALLHALGRCRDLFPAGADYLQKLPLGAGAAECICPRTDRLSSGSPLWCVQFAENLWAGTAEQRDNSPALQSVFSHLNGEHPGLCLPAKMLDGRLPLPVSRSNVSLQDFSPIRQALRAGLEALSFEEPSLNGLMNLLEDCLSFVPSAQADDISLYDQSKLNAAIAACVCEYLLSRSNPDFRSALQAESFREEQAFLLYSADFSGIQKFIFTVATSRALASLRSRSFFLELLMEHYIDELLAACDLSRANLLYSGGGHCYILLPNTPAAREAAEAWNGRFNSWLLEEFGALLFIAHGYTPCCGNDLANIPAGQGRYTDMFRRVSAAITAHKLSRYSPEQLCRINFGFHTDTGRECIICGRSDRLNADSRCPWCELFVRLSPKILSQDVYLVTGDTRDCDFTLPAHEGTVAFTLTNESAVRNRPESGETRVRIYQKNRFSGSLPQAIRLFVGDYAADREMNTLAAASTGIQRLAVCRMDVDNLGHAFTSGYRIPEETDPAKRDRYLTLARTAAFSRQMSVFFKCYINGILAGAGPGGASLAVAIVYSGGDDIFLVGAWSDVITAARRIQSAFAAFCGGSLTLSAGISLHTATFPIRAAAARSAELEDRAKQTPGKNALALFDPEADHTYSWAEFTSDVLGQKLKKLQEFFLQEEQERGSAFLYQLLELLLQSPEEKIHLARYAYLLAKMEPRERFRQESYRSFSQDMYRWALSSRDRKQLITAIYLFIYYGKEG